MVGRLHGPVGPTGLRGRARDCALLDDLVAAIGRGESRWLVLWGEAGIGETALLDHMIASESDLTVVRAAGVDSYDTSPADARAVLDDVQSAQVALLTTHIDQGLRRRWRHGAGAPAWRASPSSPRLETQPKGMA